jgi:hypothetical protein
MTRYFYSLLISLVVSLLLVAGFNRVVNPYGIFTGPEIAALNRDKPETLTRQRMSKAYQVAYRKPEAIILGTSRAIALNPEHPHWASLRRYNLALTSSSIYEQWRYLQHAQAINPLREVVIGMDYFMFNHRTGKNFREARLAVKPDGRAQWNLAGYEINDLMAGLLSLSAFRSSLATIEQQGKVHDPVEEKRERIIAKGGHWGLFTDMERDLFQTYASASVQRSYGEIGSYDEPGCMRKIIRLAQQSNIRLTLFISPSHARMWEVWRIVGLSKTLESWKQVLVEANEDEAKRAGKAPFPLWDFSGYNSVTTERLPTHDEVEQLMFGYWEGSHYSEAVGVMILDRLFDNGAAGEKLPGDFGVALSSQNIAAHLLQEQQAGERYRHDYAAEIKAMEELYTYYRRQKEAQ